MLQLKPEDRPEACDLIKDPMFVPVLQSGALHPNALKHQSSLAHMAESPTGVYEAHVPVRMPRASSAPPELSKYPPCRATSTKAHHAAL
jgi:hypothetical protein